MTEALDSTIEYLKNNPAIEEVIFTGGDPLMLNDISLQNTLERFLNIDSIKILRLHSRVPVTLPSRLNLELKNILRNTIDFYKKQILVVTHFNHPNELSAFALNQIQNFQKSGIQFSNQSVLLKNVNDSVVTLKNLFQTLYVNGINTLYLHHPDLTKGTNYFRTSIMRGQNLVRELQGKVSSGAFPHYVLDVPGGLGKISLLDSHRIKLKKSFSDKENNLGADFYEINTIETAEQKPQQVNYADFFSLSIS